MPAIHDSFRLDFSVQSIGEDEETGALMVALRPNPERYEWIEHNGERALFDRFDSYIIPERVLAEASRLMPDLPSTFALPLIDDAMAYIESRQKPIAEKLAGKASAVGSADPSEALLSEMAGSSLDFAIISVDLVGSTSLAGLMPSADYAQLIDVLCSELAEIAPLFHGHVLKFTGDGAIFYIPGPSRNQQNDLAIDCALTMRGLVYKSLNPALEAAGLPVVNVRLGIDSGQAAVKILGSPSTKQHADIIGEVVSLACKVESTAEAGEIRVGGVAARGMHTHWRECLDEVSPSKGWSYRDEDGDPYPVFRVTDGS